MAIINVTEEVNLCATVSIFSKEGACTEMDIVTALLIINNPCHSLGIVVNYQDYMQPTVAETHLCLLNLNLRGLARLIVCNSYSG